MKKHIQTSAAVAATLALALLNAGPTLASDPPVGGGGDPKGDDQILVLSAEQAASKLLKESMIANLAAGNSKVASGASTQGPCPEPEATPTSTMTASSECYTPSRWTLGVSPRQQETWYWCGPAVAQAVSSYSWGYVRYSQATINANWTQTEANGYQTYLWREILAMNEASDLPANFAYMQKNSPSFTNWHNTIISGIYNWRMPLAAGVRPHDIGAYYYIISWPYEQNASHYIGIAGYDGYASTTNAYRKVLYSDTAGPHSGASWISAGNYWDISWDVYQTMMANNGNMIY